MEAKEILCVCGHLASQHIDGEWDCQESIVYGNDNYEVQCECSFFFPGTN
jgi:hypothetical protein